LWERIKVIQFQGSPGSTSKRGGKKEMSANKEEGKKANKNRRTNTEEKIVGYHWK